MIIKHLKTMISKKDNESIAKQGFLEYNYNILERSSTKTLSKDIWDRKQGGDIENIVDVQTGKTAVNTTNTLLRSSGIGSCVVVALLDPDTGIGGLAHIMLPGRAPKNQKHTDTRHAANAIETVLEKMIDSGAIRTNIISCIAGGGNVLKRTDDTICEANITSVIDLLAEHKIPIKEKSIGGTERRRVILDSSLGTVICGIADDEDKMIFKIN